MGKNWSSSVTGSSNHYFTAGNWTLASGRVFTEAEERSGAAVCVVGETVRNKLFGQGESCRQRDSSETVLVRRHRSAEIKGTGINGSGIRTTPLLSR